MDLFKDVELSALVSTAIYCGFGLLLYVICYFLIEKLTPFSVRKEIEEDQNTSLGIIIGCMMLGLAIIIGAVIMSPSDRRQPPRGPVISATMPAPAVPAARSE